MRIPGSTTARRGRAIAIALAILAAATAATLHPANPAGAAPQLVTHELRSDAIYRSGSTPGLKVNVLLPANYDPDRTTPYRVLYLLHGGAGKWDDWANNGVADIVTSAGFDGIVVMPEGGSTGYYTNWWGHADGGFWPDWETFHIDELVPWVDANFNTEASRSGRAIAGASMGGFGALKYAGQHPELFSAVGSFSGATNIRLRDAATGGSANVPPTISQHMVGSGACIRTVNCLDGATRVNLYENGWPWPVPDEARQQAYRMETLFGPESNYPNVNPYDMARAYASYGGQLALYSGGQSSGERDMYMHNRVLRDELDRLGVAHRWCVGNGDHSWTYWKRDLADFLAFISGTPIGCHY